MKKKILNLCLCLLLAVSTAVGLAGCNKDKLKIELTVADNVSTVQPGSSVQFSAKTSKEDVGRPSFRITEGSDHGSISETGLLTVDNDAVKDSVIKVEAYIGDTKSNNISLTVEVVDVTSLTLAVPNNVTNLERGHDIQLQATINPSNATNKAVTYQFVSGEENATLSDTGVLKIDSDAPINATVTVKAVCGTIESNQLTFTVIETPESLIEVRFEEDAVTVDSKSSQATKRLIPSAFDVDEKRITGMTFTYSVVSGNEYVTVDANGVVTPLGHGTAVVRATAAGSVGYGECTITSIVPPTTIELNEELEGKTRYGFGIKNLFSSEAEKPYETLTFTVTGVGETATQKVSQDYTYKFFANNQEDPTLATINEGKITFADKAVGKDVKIVVKSNSGSAIEATKEFVVSVNAGYNIRTVAELNSFYAKSEAERSNVVLNILNDIVFTEKTEVKGLDFYKSFTLYGNGYTLDYSSETLIARKSTDVIGNSISNIAPIFTVDNALNLGENDVALTDRGTTTAIVNVYDLNAQGPLELNDISEETGFIPSVNGLRTLFLIRGADEVDVRRYNNILKDKHGNAVYTKLNQKSGGINLSMDNININGFAVGIRAEFTRNGSKLSNITIENSFYTGIQTVASMLELNNLTIGSAGVYAIEISPDSWNMAGANYNQPQEITFTGKTNFRNLVDLGNPTSYMKGDQVAQLTAQLFGNAVSGLGEVYSSADDVTYMLNCLKGTGATDVINWEIIVLNDIYETVYTYETVNNSIILFENEAGFMYEAVNALNPNAPTLVKAGSNLISVGIDIPPGMMGNPSSIFAGTIYLYNRMAE